MTTTSTQDRTTALLLHLHPTETMRSGGDHGHGVTLNCGCGESFDVENGTHEIDPDGLTVRGWALARRRHAEHVRSVSETLIAQDAAEAAGPLESDETRAVARLDEDGGQALAEFARRYGMRPDWHEPDEQGVGARVIGTHLDNAFGAEAGRRVHSGHDFTEFNVVLTVEDEDGNPQDRGVVNLATLLSIAAARES